MWGWLGRLLAVLLGLTVQPDLMIRPDFKTREKGKQAVAVWVVGHTVWYLLSARPVVAAKFKDYILTEKEKVFRCVFRWPAFLSENLAKYVK